MPALQEFCTKEKHFTQPFIYARVARPVQPAQGKTNLKAQVPMELEKQDLVQSRDLISRKVCEMKVVYANGGRFDAKLKQASKSPTAALSSA